MTSLLVYSNHGFGSYSSYPVISKYISNCTTISTLRAEPRTLKQRALNRLVRTFAASQWYKLTSLELEWRLIQRLHKSHPDLIHFLWAERDLGYADWINRVASFPLCCTFHCCPEDLPSILPYRKRLQSLSALIIMSETQRAFFESCGIASEKIHCIPHGIDTEFFTPSSDRRTENQFVVLSIGSYKRNFPLLREVAIKLKRYPDIRLKVVSSQDFYQYFSELENVEFISGLSDAELVKAYQSASCLLMTVENATANNAILEGLACGLPVIAEEIGGIPEYVNSDSAMLSEARNADLLVESIVHLASAPLKRDQMAQAARTHALEFSWDKVARRTEELYQSLM
ncbi:glycosyltransferase family 4 protein [Leptolyngbya sp. DQ-M1]|uniref:glycosyltransferase family 4 protein n=1 Tax=Leptolyngbya sp. DQ-M1 TaxID=2933920 RepID=UPI0032976C42